MQTVQKNAVGLDGKYSLLAILIPEGKILLRKGRSGAACPPSEVTKALSSEDCGVDVDELVSQSSVSTASDKPKFSSEIIVRVARRFPFGILSYENTKYATSSVQSF